MVKEDRDRTSYGIQFRCLPYVDLMIYSSALLLTDTCLEKKKNLNLLCYLKLQISLSSSFILLLEEAWDMHKVQGC